MQTPDRILLRTEGSAGVDDTILAGLNELSAAEEGRLVEQGGPGVDYDELDPERPYDLETVKPRAISIRKLYTLVGKAIPAEIEAALGANVPVLVSHGMTAFNLAGEKPRQVWGMGYEAHLGNVVADTISLSPDTQIAQIATLESTVKVGMSLAGQLAAPEEALEILNAVPGLALHGASLSATTSQQFALAIQFTFNLLKVQAGPVGAGGVRWNLYRHGQHLESFQPLLQTLLVPKGTSQLNFSVKCWVRRRGWFFGFLGSRQFTSPERAFEVSLQGLDS